MTKRKKYLTPNLSQMYIAPRGIDPLFYHVTGIALVSRIVALIDVKHEFGKIGESQAQQLLSMVRKVTAETIQYN